jgi:hypothetical protein
MEEQKAGGGSGRQPSPCVRFDECGNTLERAGGLSFFSYLNHGSRHVELLNGEQVQIHVCDECLERSLSTGLAAWIVPDDEG